VAVEAVAVDQLLALLEVDKVVALVFYQVVPEQAVAPMLALGVREETQL